MHAIDGQIEQQSETASFGDFRVPGSDFCYTGTHRRLLKLYGFNGDYVRRLAEGDSFVEQHFSAYFGELLLVKLRRRLRSPQLMEDVRQETFYRVLRALRSGLDLQHPERFGAYVNTVCDNVVLELGRQDRRHPQINDETWDPADERVDLDFELITEERKRLVKRTLGELSRRDREVLGLLFLEELPPDQVCERLHVDREYLRVLVHRAKARFKARIEKAFSAGGPSAM